VCQTWGEAIGPNANRLWWLVSYAGRQFYVNDRYLSTSPVANTPIAGQPWCGQPVVPAPAQPPAPAPAGDTLAANVANWARAHVGVRYATPAERALMRQTGSDWLRRGDGPLGEWSGDCARFAYLAWHANGVRPIKGATAKAVGDAYTRAGRMRGGEPPVGALVFYHWGRYGHVGISLGGGQVVSTQGMDYARRPIRQHAYNGIGLGYRGWADPR
jgi:cell wall-associated NlpC family hydrolase